MRAVVITSPGGPESLRMIDTPLPEPRADQIRIRVAAVAVNPVDVLTRQGVFHQLGWIKQSGTTGIGWDVAGTVDALGSDVRGPAIGTTVAAVLTALDVPLGTYADAVVVPASAVAVIPEGLAVVRAATLPLNALTADQALDLLALAPRASVLITGAAGGVGGFAVALAARRGLRVTALARAGDGEFVRSAGANALLTDLRGQEACFDGVLDAASLVDPAIASVREGGVYVGVFPAAVPESVRGIRTSAVNVRQDGARLADLLAMAAAGELEVRIAGTLPLADAAEAHRRIEHGGSRGRWVLVP